MSINGTKGRAKEMSRIRKKHLAAALATGIDISDRAAVAKYTEKQSKLFWDGLHARFTKDVSND